METATAPDYRAIRNLAETNATYCQYEAAARLFREAAELAPDEFWKNYCIRRAEQQESWIGDPSSECAK